MKRVLKKFIAVICLVSVLSTAFVFPIVSTPVQADAIAVESGSAYIYRVIVTLLSKVGVGLPTWSCLLWALFSSEKALA